MHSISRVPSIISLPLAAAVRVTTPAEVTLALEIVPSARTTRRQGIELVTTNLP
nr:MAG TPA: hypothetical protein [Caudoviricetes sp.]